MSIEAVMNKYFIFTNILLIIFALVSHSTTAFAESSWRLQGTSTFVVMDYPELKKPNVHGIFLINFNRKLECKPEIETMMIEGETLGHPIKNSLVNSKMVITIDNKYVFSEKTSVTKYDNAYSTTFIGTQEVIDRLKAGSIVKSVMLPDLPIFVFPLSGARESIDKARNACY